MPGALTIICATFLSTFPLRGTSRACMRRGRAGRISIHVPLAGNVRLYSRSGRCHTHFYPRSPCGERQLLALENYLPQDISIHVPLAGNVARWAEIAAGVSDFYPRSPCGERPSHHLKSDCGSPISIHVPLAGNVGGETMPYDIGPISIHVPLAGNVPPSAIFAPTWSAFLSTFPLRGTSPWLILSVRAA